jgi:hypothetical protein
MLTPTPRRALVAVVLVLTCDARKVCVPHYLRQVADGSLSSFVRWTTIRNVRLNADRSQGATVYPRSRVFP